ncbi:MAG: murein biosynthesis integral membrane protein MurJ [Anaerolineae bacterium]|nr:murein biosynthesis integral membrane protein MurJ [Anaerolineae bacterium]
MAAEQPLLPQSGLARSAGILALGNVASRALGLAREIVISHLFGASGLVSAFRVASIVPTMLYALLIGGLLSAALVPVLSEYAGGRQKQGSGRAAGAILGLVAVGGALIVLLLELFAPQVIWLMGSGFDDSLRAVAVRSLRILAPAVWCFFCSGIVTGILYARHRFTYPALAAAAFNLGIVVAAPLLVGRLDIYSLAVGVLLGSIVQLALQLPGLRGSGLRLSLDWRHPALARMAQLYLPIALGLIVTQVQIAVDRNLASGTGENSIAWMQNATTLIQFPLGLVAVAISLAALPSLSQLSAAGDWDGYRRTLARGLRLVLVLILPAAVGLWVLGEPLIRLIFEHGAFGPADTLWTTRALLLYLLGLVFAAIDWPLNYAFYARQDTRTPAFVGVFSVGLYLAVALLLVGRLGMLGLVLADSAKQVGHALVMLVFLRRRVGSLAGYGVATAGARAALAAVIMGGGVWLARGALERGGIAEGALAETTVVAVGGAVGIILYFSVLAVLRLEEAGILSAEVVRRLRGG